MTEELMNSGFESEDTASLSSIKEGGQTSSLDMLDDFHAMNAKEWVDFNQK